MAKQENDVKYPIPKEALDQHIVALGKTGRGKSSAIRGGFVEPLLDANEPVCILDPKGDWWGLKSSADGKRAGYPVVIFGGEHADVAINEHSGAHIAELVATGNRPCIIDLGGWMVGERTRFFISFASTLFKLTRGKRWLVMDECHNFAPQGKILDVDAGKMLHWANRLASEGRGKGINIIAASQRPQKVHKDFLTSMETLIAMGVVHKLDRDAVKDWIDGCADSATGKEVIATLAGLPRGEAWVWSPEIDFGPARIKFPFFRTYDSFKPQSAEAGKLKGWAEVDLDEVKAKLVAVVEEAKANDPTELKKRIRELERQVAAQPAPGATPEELAAAERRGSQAGFQAGMCRAFTEIEALAERMTKALPAIDARPENPVRRVEPAARAARLPDPAPTVARARQIDGRASSPDADLGTGGKRRILTALAQYPEGMTQRKLSILVDIAPKGGTWRTYMAELRSRGWIEGRKDHLCITDAGLAALGDFQPLPTGKALIEYWRQRLGDSGKRKIFDVVVDAHPNAISVEDVSRETNIASAGGTWRTYIAELRGLGIVEGRGELKASEDLFA